MERAELVAKLNAEGYTRCILLPTGQLAGIMPRQGPAWYVVLQAVVGLSQFAIALAMLAGCRKTGVWGAF